MTTRFCERCEKTVPKIGLHNCVKAKVSQPETPAKTAETSRPVTSVTNQVNSVTKKNETVTSPLGFASAYERLQKRLEVDRNRQARWRAANLDRYRENQRDIMRKRRAEELLKQVRAI
jgi:hypothetical protein